MGNGAVEGRQVQRQLATGVQREGRAVKDRLVLPSDHIKADQRQLRLDHPRDHMIQPPVHCAALMWGCIRDQKEFGPRFGLRLGHIASPAIRPDGGADAQPLNRIGATDRACIKVRVLRGAVLKHPLGDLATL